MTVTKKTEEVEVVKENFMRLEQYIELLQELLKTEGNLPVTYSQDDEGNSYSYNRYAPSAVLYVGVLYVGVLDGHRQHLDLIDKETAAKTKQTVFKAICIN